MLPTHLLTNTNKIKNTEANDVIFTIKNYWPDINNAISNLQEYEIEYIVLDAEGKEIGAFGQNLKTDYTYNYMVLVNKCVGNIYSTIYRCWYPQIFINIGIQVIA